MKICICQLICPLRHCIGAVCYEEISPSDVRRAEESLRAKLSEMGIANRCGICGSEELRCDHSEIPFSSVGEAEPWLRTEMAKNLMTRAALDAAGLTEDVKRRNRNN